MENQGAVDKLIKQVLFDEYAKSDKFLIDKEGLMKLASSSDEQIDNYLGAAVSSGVDIEAASVCIILFLKLKISQNAS